MGLFTTNQTNTANSVYEETKKYLKEKNGNVHILVNQATRYSDVKINIQLN